MDKQAISTLLSLNFKNANIDSLNTLNIIFNEKNLNYIIEHDLIRVLISLEYNYRMRNECYCLIYFKLCNLTEYLSLHNAKGIHFFNKLIEISNNKESLLKSDIIHKIGENRYIIIIPDEFYSNNNEKSIKRLFRYLGEGDFYETFKDEVAKHRKNIISLVDTFGGVDENIFLTYDYYVKRDVN
jgi:hypothetical protein